MIDITPITIAIVTVGLPVALGWLYTTWMRWKPSKESPEYEIRHAADQLVKLAQDLRESGYFGDLEKTGAAALDWAADRLHTELKNKGIDLDLGKCVDAARIAYQEWKTEK